MRKAKLKNGRVKRSATPKESLPSKDLSASLRDSVADLIEEIVEGTRPGDRFWE